jgi:hypothetical protein
VTPPCAVARVQRREKCSRGASTTTAATVTARRATSCCRSEWTRSSGEKLWTCRAAAGTARRCAVKVGCTHGEAASQGESLVVHCSAAVSVVVLCCVWSVWCVWCVVLRQLGQGHKTSLTVPRVAMHGKGGGVVRVACGTAHTAAVTGAFVTRSTMPCHAMPCHAMPCDTMPCHAMQCNAMPCHAMRGNDMMLLLLLSRRR